MYNKDILTHMNGNVQWLLLPQLQCSFLHSLHFPDPRFQWSRGARVATSNERPRLHIAVVSWRQTEHENNEMLDEQQQKHMLNHQWNDKMLTGWWGEWMIVENCHYHSLSLLNWVVKGSLIIHTFQVFHSLTLNHHQVGNLRYLQKSPHLELLSLNDGKVIWYAIWNG